MPLAFLAALAGSLFIHAAVLFLPDVDLSPAPEPPPLVIAEIQLPKLPAPAVRPKKGPVKAPDSTAKHHPNAGQGRPAGPSEEPADESPVPDVIPQSEVLPVEPAPTALVSEGNPEPSSPPVVATRLPARGRIVFAVYKGDQGLEVGRAEEAWEFNENTYRFTWIQETVGLAALFKPIRIELESRGTVTSLGLKPERLTTQRNGQATRENVHFDWDSRLLTLERNGSQHELTDGAQDLLSFHFQFGYLASLEQGIEMPVASGRKFEHYRFATVGEENIQTPAGHFRVLHVRVQTDSTTELWLALDHLLIPVKIRHTDRKGESFEQVATELGI